MKIGFSRFKMCFTMTFSWIQLTAPINCYKNQLKFNYITIWWPEICAIQIQMVLSSITCNSSTKISCRYQMSSIFSQTRTMSIIFKALANLWITFTIRPAIWLAWSCSGNYPAQTPSQDRKVWPNYRSHATPSANFYRLSVDSIPY